MNEEQIKALIRKEILRILGDSSSFPLEIQRSLQAKGFLYMPKLGRGIAKISDNGDVTTITPLAGTNPMWVASTSGGPTTSEFTFTDGILTS